MMSSAYFPQATYDDGSCGAIYKGCTDSNSATFRPLANRASPEDCAYTGCMQSHAHNFDPSATRPGICTARRFGCADPAAVNFVPGTNVDSKCRYAGCTNSHAPNWDPSANVDSGRCGSLLSCCTDSRFVNYVAHCNHDDGSCSRWGCMDPASSIYDSQATFDDITSCGSRRRFIGSASGCRDPSALTFDSSVYLHAQKTCMYAIPGCPDSAAENYLSIAYVYPSAAGHASCTISVPGCMLSEGTLNFDSQANVLEGCVYAVRGCTESGAVAIVC